jgi:uncharacterized protein (TIGR03435 family)
MIHRIVNRLNVGRIFLLAAAAGAAPIVVVFSAAPQTLAQAQLGTAAPLAFEIASVKPDKEGPARSAQDRLLPGNQTYVVSNFSLEMLIMTAYAITPDRLSGGPNWPGSERWDIEAKSDRPITRPEALIMLQNLLADRFKLKLRRETKEVPIYVLVIEKDGSKLRENTDKAQSGMTPGRDNSRAHGDIVGHNVSMPVLTQFLSVRLGRSIVDATGLKGGFDWELRFDQQGIPDDGAPHDSAGLPDLLTAVRLQLGLKLDSQRGPVDSFIIEHAEKPSGN